MIKVRQNFPLRFAIGLALLCAAQVALAHEVGPEQEGPENLHDLWRTWGWEPGTLIGLALSAWLYIAGLWRLWRASGMGHGIRRWEAWCFCGGGGTLFFAAGLSRYSLGQGAFFGP